MSKIIVILVVLFSLPSFAITTQYKKSDCEDNTKMAQLVLDVRNQVFCAASADENLCEDLDKNKLSAFTVSQLGLASGAVLVNRAFRTMPPSATCTGKSAKKGLFLINKAWAAGTCSIGANIFQTAREHIELEESTLKNMRSELKKFISSKNPAPSAEDIKLAKARLLAVNRSYYRIKNRKSSFNKLANRARNMDASKFKLNFGEELWTRDKFGQKSNAKKYGLKELLGIESVSYEPLDRHRPAGAKRKVVKVLDEEANRLFKEVFDPNIAVFDDPKILSKLSGLQEQSEKVKAHKARLFRSTLYSENMTDAQWRNSIINFSGNTGKAALRKAMATMFFSAGVVLEVAASPSDLMCSDSAAKNIDPRYNLFQRKESDCGAFEPIRKLSDPGLVELFMNNSPEEIVSMMLKGGSDDVTSLSLCRALIPFANSSGIRGWQASCTSKGVSLQPRRHNYDNGRPYGNRIEVFNTDTGYDVYNSYSPVGLGSNGQYYASFKNDGEITDIKQLRRRGHFGERFKADKLAKAIESTKRKKSSDEFSKAAGYAHRFSLQAVNQTRRCCSGGDISQTICNAYGIEKAGSKSGQPSVNTGDGSGVN